jgi:hypothetical protein
LSAFGAGRGRTEFLLGLLEAAPPFGSTEEVVEDSTTDDHDGANTQNLPPIDLAAADAGGRSGLHNGHSGVVHLAVFLLERKRGRKESKRLREGK